MTTYTVSVYAGVPAKDDEPLLSFVIKADGGAEAIDAVKSKAAVKSGGGTYVEAKPLKSARLTP